MLYFQATNYYIYFLCLIGIVETEAGDIEKLVLISVTKCDSAYIYGLFLLCYYWIIVLKSHIGAETQTQFLTSEVTVAC